VKFGGFKKNFFIVLKYINPFKFIKIKVNKRYVQSVFVRGLANPLLLYLAVKKYGLNSLKNMG
jgi:hypothetical protein